eukprot:365399-Chlamydomonas_euryale.AAC.6
MEACRSAPAASRRLVGGDEEGDAPLGDTNAHMRTRVPHPCHAFPTHAMRSPLTPCVPHRASWRGGRRRFRRVPTAFGMHGGVYGGMVGRFVCRQGQLSRLISLENAVPSVSASF